MELNNELNKIMYMYKQFFRNCFIHVLFPKSKDEQWNHMVTTVTI